MHSNQIPVSDANHRSEKNPDSLISDYPHTRELLYFGGLFEGKLSSQESRYMRETKESRTYLKREQESRSRRSDWEYEETSDSTIFLSKNSRFYTFSHEEEHPTSWKLLSVSEHTSPRLSGTLRPDPLSHQTRNPIAVTLLSLIRITRTHRCQCVPVDTWLPQLLFLPTRGRQAFDLPLFPH